MGVVDGEPGCGAGLTACTLITRGEGTWAGSPQGTPRRVHRRSENLEARPVRDQARARPLRLVPDQAHRNPRRLRTPFDQVKAQLAANLQLERYQKFLADHLKAAEAR